MARAEQKGGSLGGIGTMLLQSEVCPACGKAHGSRLTRYLPAVGRAPSEDRLPVETPILVSTKVGQPASRPRRSSLSIPWPMPKQSEEYP
jgi:hypothetical protein